MRGRPSGKRPGMRELLPGLYHWTTPHPNIGQDVSSYYVTGAAALLDPMVPTEAGSPLPANE